MPISITKPFAQVVAATVLLMTAGVGGAQAQSENSANDAFRQLHLFGDVFERVRSLYVDEKSDQELIEAAINGMLTSLDPHSAFLPIEEAEDMRTETSGRFGGLGIEVTMENGLIKVVSPIDETPAARAGVQAGDLISFLDGDPVMGLSLSDAVERMRGEVGTDITITVLRGELEPFDIVITRDIIKIQSVRARVEDELIGYLRINSFSGTTYEGLEREIEEMQEEHGDKLIGYILDLRNNPGGLLRQSVLVSDAFLEKGEIVSTRGRDEDDVQRFDATKGDLLSGAPLVVLVNGGSASASEIVAGALKDHRRAVILGTQTFGKGSVQTVMDMPGYGAMRLTTARYYTPAGTSIQATGITPDLDIPQSRVESLETNRRRGEADLRGSLENPDGATDEEVAPATEDTPATEEPVVDEPTADEPSTEAPAADQNPDGDAEAEAETEEEELIDYQLQRAKDLLRGLAIFSGTMASN